MNSAANPSRVFLRGLRFLRAPRVPRTIFNYFTTKKQITGNNNLLTYQVGSIKQTRIEISGNQNSISVGSGSDIFKMKIFMFGNENRICIKENVRCGDSMLWVEGTRCEIRIDPGTTINGAHIAALEGTAVHIGADCMFAHGIEIRTGDSHSILDQRTGMRINPAQDVVIHRNVWLAANVTILKGVTIGAGSVVGTGSVVTKSIPPNSLAVGVPARVVKTEIEWRREQL